MSENNQPTRSFNKGTLKNVFGEDKYLRLVTIFLSIVWWILGHRLSSIAWYDWAYVYRYLWTYFTLFVFGLIFLVFFRGFKPIAKNSFVLVLLILFGLAILYFFFLMSLWGPGPHDF